MIKSLFNNPKELKRLYIDEEKSLAEIGYICGVAFQTVSKWLKRHNIKARPYGTSGLKLKGKRVPKREKDLNEPHWRTGTKLEPEHRKNTIKALKNNWKSGKDNPNWKGGTTLDHGYRILRINGKRIREHRYVMEQHLGRKLTRKEQIHHINGDKLDNRIENLMVLSNAEHQRLHWKERPLEEQKEIIENLQEARKMKKLQT